MVEGNLGRADADLADIALEVADRDPVANLYRTLDQQNQPRDEVADDRLQAEAEAEKPVPKGKK